MWNTSSERAGVEIQNLLLNRHFSQVGSCKKDSLRMPGTGQSVIGEEQELRKSIVLGIEEED
jgi:hypothetical protein